MDARAAERMTTEQAQAIARRHFNAADGDWNVLGALARDGEITPQTFEALSEYHADAHGAPMTCESVVAGELCDVLALRWWVHRHAGDFEVPSGASDQRFRESLRSTARGFSKRHHPPRALTDRRAGLQDIDPEGKEATMTTEQRVPDLSAAHGEIRRYIDGIRNRAKRAYAERYYHAVIRNGLPEPSTGGLSTMGAQAVRLRIAEIIKQS